MVYLIPGKRLQKFDLVGVGIGPGDPDLITVKALKSLNSVDVVFAPKPKDGGNSLALSIVRNVVNMDNKEVVELLLPMTRSEDGLRKARDSAVRKMITSVEEGKRAAFITLGDPMLYSTFTYLMSSILTIRKETKIEVIPGISSIMASAAVSLTPLGESDQKVAIMPLTQGNFGEIQELLKRVDTLVLMKVNRCFDELVDFVIKEKLEKRAVFVSKTGREGEAMLLDITSLKGTRIDYFSTVIIRAQDE
ncbi:MAG: precorrin-2 C(20)-methyltransferase [Nitrospinota bacterium]